MKELAINILETIIDNKYKVEDIQKCEINEHYLQILLQSENKSSYYEILWKSLYSVNDLFVGIKVYMKDWTVFITKWHND